MNRAQPATTRHETTYTDVGNADIAGANIYRPWWLNTRIRPLRTVEVQVLQEQKPAMRVMVIANCARFTSLAVNETVVNVVKLLKVMLNTLNLVPFTAVPLILRSMEWDPSSEFFQLTFTNKKGGSKGFLPKQPVSIRA